MTIEGFDQTEYQLIEIRSGKISKIASAMEMDPNEESVRRQIAVFVDAMEIYKERNKRHKDVWKDSGWQGALFDSRKKVERLWNEFMGSPNPPKDFDSALDAINFLAFFIRAREDGTESVWRWTGDGK